MKIMDLIRVGSTEKGTFGVLRYDGIPFAVTVERPWHDNHADISSIPAGTYLCKRVHSPRFGHTFEVTNVPGRENILFHKGNSVLDTKGCILIGESFVEMSRIADSSGGYAEFLAILGKDAEFRLRIVEVVIK